MVRVPLATLIAAGLLLLGVAAPASAKTTWLCKPGHSPNPCAGPLNATQLSVSGKSTGKVEKAKPAAKPPIDCFYVYPTVSDQQTTNANLHIDPEETAIAKYQASRFSTACRVWAPMYKQVTLKGILNGSGIPALNQGIAYDSARAAWRDYISHQNKGRGFVLIGHSQGTFILRRLIADEIDSKPALRKRMVSALLLGGNVTVKKGKTSGGDFKHVKACRTGTQLGCVVAYSTYGEQPPANSIFGRVPAKDASKLQVLCTDPGALAGGPGPLRTYIPTSPFPGTLGVGVALEIGPLPKVSTPWVAQRGYTSRCVNSGGASVLRLTPKPGARVLPPVPDPTWGLHLSDVNIALGNLTALVHRQAAAYARANR